MSADSKVATPYSILIVSFRNSIALEQCLASVNLFATDAASVLVWDNFSDNSDAIRDLAARHPQVSWTFSDSNIGFAAAVNSLARRCHPHDLLLLNPDAILTRPPTVLGEAVREADVGAAGPAFPPVPGARTWDNARPLANPINAAIEQAGLGRIAKGPIVASRYQRPRTRVGYLSGACLYISRRAWDQVGEFDERYWLYSEEMDWARRAARHGLRLHQVHMYLVEHASGGTVADNHELSAISRERLDSSIELYLRIHFGRLGPLIFIVSSTILARSIQLARRLRTPS